MKALTPKQEAFCQHYVLHGDATRAYKVAYSSQSSNETGIRANASKLLKNTAVAQRVALLKDKTAEVAARTIVAQQASVNAVEDEKFEISAEKVIQELATIGFANIKDYVRIDGDGIPLPDFTNVTRKQFAAIGEITFEDIETGQRTGKRVKFKLLDKRGALVDLGRYLGVFKDDRPQTGNTVNINVISDAAADFDSKLAQVIARTAAERSSDGDDASGESSVPIRLETMGPAGSA